jgi:hypothetical protein
MARLPVRACALAAAVGLAACADVSAPPAVTDDGLGVPLGYEGGTLDLTWIPGTRRVAFRAPGSGTTPCAVRTLHVDSGALAALDTDCVTLTAFAAGPLRGLAASAAGSVVAWQVGIAGSDPAGGAVRVAPAGPPAIEVRRASRLWPSVAVSPDGRWVAFAWSLLDSLVVRDLVTGAEAGIDFALPIAFSPDGRSLAYLIGPGSVRRRLVGSAAESVVQLGLNPGDGLGPMVWDSSGLWAVLDRLGGGIRLRNTTTGAEVVATPFDFGKQIRFPTWSADGRRLAFWEQYCEPADPGTPCTVEQATLIVFERDTGRRLVAARGRAVGGPIALSPGGSEVVYAFGGALYRDSVPDE